MTTKQKFKLWLITALYHQQIAEIYFQAFNQGADLPEDERDQLQRSCEFYKTQQVRAEVEVERLGAIVYKSVEPAANETAG